MIHNLCNCTGHHTPTSAFSYNAKNLYHMSLHSLVEQAEGISSGNGGQEMDGQEEVEKLDYSGEGWS